MSIRDRALRGFLILATLVAQCLPWAHAHTPEAFDHDPLHGRQTSHAALAHVHLRFFGAHDSAGHEALHAAGHEAIRAGDQDDHDHDALCGGERTAIFARPLEMARLSAGWPANPAFAPAAYSQLVGQGSTWPEPCMLATPPPGRWRSNLPIYLQTQSLRI